MNATREKSKIRKLIHHHPEWTKRWELELDKENVKVDFYKP